MKKLLSILGYLLSVGFNIPHLVATYNHLGTDAAMPSWYVYIIMGSFDLAVLILAILYKPEEDVKIDPGYVFAFILFILNLYLYWSPLSFPYSAGEVWGLVPGLCFSFVPAFLVYFCAGEISNQFKELNKSDRERLNELELISHQLELDRLELDQVRQVLAFNSLFIGEKLQVDGVKARIHTCGRVVVAGSNREKKRQCECGETINWN